MRPEVSPLVCVLCASFQGGTIRSWHLEKTSPFTWLGFC